MRVTQQGVAQHTNGCLQQRDLHALLLDRTRRLRLPMSDYDPSVTTGLFNMNSVNICCA